MDSESSEPLYAPDYEALRRSCHDRTKKALKVSRFQNPAYVDRQILSFPGRRRVSSRESDARGKKKPWRRLDESKRFAIASEERRIDDESSRSGGYSHTGPLSWPSGPKRARATPI